VIRRKSEKKDLGTTSKTNSQKMKNIYEMLLKHLRFHMISCNGIVERVVSPMNGKKVTITKSVRVSEASRFPKPSNPVEIV
jgi:hypothetical protein